MSCSRIQEIHQASLFMLVVVVIVTVLTQYNWLDFLYFFLKLENIYSRKVRF